MRSARVATALIALFSLSCQPMPARTRRAPVEPPAEVPGVQPPPGSRFGWPLKKAGEAVVMSPFGVRVVPELGTDEIHLGVDLAAGPDSPVVAARDGKVIWAGERPAFGWTVILEHADRWQTVYGNLRPPRLRVGDPVGMGEELGRVGEHCDGSGGSCLHFEVRWKGTAVDPMPLLLGGAR